MIKNATPNKISFCILALASIIAVLTPWYMITEKIDETVEFKKGNSWFFAWEIALGTSSEQVNPGVFSIYFHDQSVTYEEVSEYFSQSFGGKNVANLEKAIMGACALTVLNILFCLLGILLASRGFIVRWIFAVIFVTSAASWIAVGLAGPEYMKIYDEMSSFEYVGVGVACAFAAFVTLSSLLMMCLVPPPRREDAYPPTSNMRQAIVE